MSSDWFPAGIEYKFKSASLNADKSLKLAFGVFLVEKI